MQVYLEFNTAYILFEFSFFITDITGKYLTVLHF